MWKLGASTLALLASLRAAQGIAVVRGFASLQDLDAPVPAQDDLYFPQQGAPQWHNPNGTHEAPSPCGAPKDPFPMPYCYGLKLEEATIDGMQAWMASGQLTSRQLTKCYIGRILQLNEYVNAVLEVNPDVLVIADQLDLERAAGTVRGPLHGVPFLVKDNIATKDKMETTAGSYALLGSILLRDKGAVLLGKSTLDEWASMRSSSKSSGYSARGGQSRNAYNLSAATSGSSSGSAQSVASNMIAFSYGTETDGSVIGPARRASIIGIKPVGPFARTFKDAVYALEAIVGVDPRDNYTLAQKVPDGGNYTKFLASKEALRGAVFGLPWSSLWDQTGNRADLPMLLDVVEKLKAAGATIINGTEFPHYKDVLSPRGYTMDVGPSPLLTEAYRTNVDFYNDIRKYLAELENTNMKTLEDIIAFNIQYTGVEGGIPGTVAGFASGQDGFLESAVTKGDMNSSYYECNEYLNRVSRAEGIDAALAYTYPNGTTIQLDGLLVPSGSGSTNLPAIAGYPMVTVPVGQNAHSVPVGIALIGTAWSEPTLIKYGSAIDDLIRRRTLPKFIEWWSKVIPVDYSV